MIKQDRPISEVVLKGINNAFELAANKIVKCQGCTQCCEKGVVYVLPEEEKKLKELKVELFEIDGIKFIQRNSDGSCTMLDKEEKKCSIYDNRPLCCRAFPLDIFSRNRRLEWAVYNYCPEDRILAYDKNKSKVRINTELVSYITSTLENNLNKNIIKYFEEEDKVVARVEYLDEHVDDYLIIGPIVNNNFAIK